MYFSNLFLLFVFSQFVPLGRAFNSSKEVALTETEMEYVVTCVKHVFESHIVLQFSVLNTIDDQQVCLAFQKIYSWRLENRLPVSTRNLSFFFPVKTNNS